MGTILSIISIILTWYFTKMQMKKNEITHFLINSYNVGKGLQNDFSKFQLTYDRNELSNEVQILKGYFINTGRNDIIGLKNESDININLPKECVLKDIIIKRKSKNLDVSAHINTDTPNVIDFAINDKFMSGEFFEYAAIVESTNDIIRLDRKLTYNHRIPNTSKIKNEYMGIQMHNNKKSLAYIFLLFAIFFSVISLFYFYVQEVKYTLLEHKTGKEVVLYITPESQLYVSDNQLIPFIDKTDITKVDFERNYKISLPAKYSWTSYNSISGFIFAFASFLYLLGSMLKFYQWYNKKKIHQILKQSEKE